MSSTDLILGIDLGGTNTKIGIGNRTGQLLKSTSIKTNSSDGFETWAHRVVEEVKKWNIEFSRVGIGSPGPLDISTGTILSTPNLKSFAGKSMIQYFEKAFQKRVSVHNDANCGVLAEYYFGEFKGHGHIVLLTLGSGVGSGVISNHKMIEGYKGYAPELGHMIVSADLAQNPKNPFESFSFEANVGALQSARNFSQTLKLEQSLKFHEIVDLKFEQRTQFLDHWAKALAYGIYNAFVIFNPEVVLLSGGVSSLWTEVEPRLSAYLETWLLQPIWKGSQLKLSILGDHFGVLGAIALTLWNEQNEQK